MSSASLSLCFDRPLKALLTAVTVFLEKPQQKYVGQRVTECNSFDHRDANSLLYQAKGAEEWLLARTFRVN